MKTVRQDAWTVEDDNVLAEIILRHIRTGSTQLTAFQEAGMKLGRTQAACGFRWNGVVRKTYAAQIEIAKAERRAHREQKQQMETLDVRDLATETSEANTTQGELTWQEVLRFLRTHRAESQVLTTRLRQLERDLDMKTSEEQQLRAENGSLRSELERVAQELQIVKEDYGALVSIMERARKMVFLGEQYQEERPKFKMDENGNLDRIE